MSLKFKLIPFNIFLFFLLLITITLYSKGIQNNNLKQFNLLLITLDTVRSDHIGAYSYKDARTPNIDQLASEGVVFENCYSPVPLTLPAHSSIFTGKYPPSHGVRDNGTYLLPQKEITLAEILQQRGFHTYGVVSSFVLLSKFGISQGFDVFDDTLNSHKMYNNYSSEIPASDVFNKFQQWFSKGYKNRFFAWIHLYDPHAPYRAPQIISKNFKNNPKGRYDSEIAYTDVIIGKIIKSLKKKNVFSNTLIIITSDHGEGFGEHLEFQHGIFCYEEMLKVPLIFFNKKLLPKKGLQIKNRVNLVDIMPTILEIFKLPTSEAIQGKSLFQLLSGNKEEKKRSFYFESMHGKNEMNWATLTGIIYDRYKFISLPEPELYDLVNDKNEKNNLFKKKRNIARNLDKKLKKMMINFTNNSLKTNTRRSINRDERKKLESLGYISPFSNNSIKNQDPKNGIILDNKIKHIFSIIAKNQYIKAEKELELLKKKYPHKKLPIQYDLNYKIQIKKKESKLAIKILKEAIQEFPKVERFYILYAFEMFNLNKYEETEKICKKLIKLNQRFTRAYILLGQIEEKKKNNRQAIRFYKKALDIEPQNISLKLKYAELKIKQKKYIDALAIYDKLLERDEIFKNAKLLLKIALFNAKCGKLNRAEQLLKKLINFAPSGQHYFSFALILAKNKKTENALHNMQIALKKYNSELNKRQIQTAQKAIIFWQKKK